MRRLLLLSSLAVWLALPCAVHAQATDPDEGATEGADAPSAEAPDEEAIADDGGYEPDQRGADEGPDTGGEGTDQSTGGGEYEPDQRGAEGEEEELDSAGADAAPMEPDRAFSVSEGEAASAARRGLGLDLQLIVGAGLNGLDAFGGDNLVQDTQRGSFGGSFGAVIGLGVGPLTVGPRATFTIEPGFVLGAIGLDVQVALTSGSIAPMMRLSVSYAFLLGMSDALPSQNAPDGVWTELGLGARFRVAGPFSIGVELAGGWIALFRGAVPGCTERCDENGLDVTESGASHGATLRLHVSGGLSF
ncbi:MAG: hypothetical protein R3B82_27470 [Sandaracinaceae bacterium]